MDHRCFNVVHQSWNDVVENVENVKNVENVTKSEVGWRWKKVEIAMHKTDIPFFQRCTTPFQRCLKLQRWYELISVLFQCGLNINYIKTNLASWKYRFADRLIRFILLNEKIWLQCINYISYSTIHKLCK